MNDGGNLDVARLEFEREKWAADLKLREREFDLRQAELEIKRAEQRGSHWRSPLTVAVFAAALAAAGNAVVALVNGNNQRDLEDRKAKAEIAVEESKAESSRILEMIKTGDPDSAADNLRFLVDTGLIATTTRVEKLSEFLANRKPGSGPALPATGGIQFEQTTELTQPLKETLEADLKAYMAYLTGIGLGENLPIIKIAIKPIFKTEGTVSYYEPGSNTMTIDPQAAPDPYASRREATHHVLMADDPQGCGSAICRALESGLADYFAASFAENPHLGDKLIKVYGGTEPFMMNVENAQPFRSIESNDLTAVYEGGQMWSGAFWAIRSKLGKAATDSILGEAWNETDRSEDDPVKTFVAAIIAAAESRGADKSAVTEILRGRGFPIPE